MRSFTSTFVLLNAAALFTQTLAAPQLLDGLTHAIGAILGEIPLLSTPPPATLRTKYPSPACSNVNRGALLCCQSAINGDIPIIVQLANLLAYKLDPNSINCIYGTRDFTDCSRGIELCCQVDALADTPTSDLVRLALYCNTPSQNESSIWQ